MRAVHACAVLLVVSGSSGCLVVMGSECERDTDCPSPDICENGYCIDAGAECAINEDCPEAEVCDAGACVVPTGEEYIVGGELTRSFAATGALLDYQSRPFCTATLVTPDRVLTAAHCVTMATAGSVRVGWGVDPGQPVVSAGVTAIWMHQSYYDVQAGNDVAVLYLDRQVTEIAPAVLHLGDVSSFVGTELTLVGYGASGAGGVGSGIRRLTRVDVAMVTAQTLAYQFRGMGACHGDSGGPAFAMVGGDWRQVGVTSWGDMTCTSFGHYQRLDVVASFLAEHGVLGEQRTTDCAANGACDGQCPDDEDCWSLVCPSGSCQAPSGQCTANGACEAQCGVSDPDCGGAVDYCQIYGRYGNGYCDPQCPQPDPDCGGAGSTCYPTQVYADTYRGVCHFYDASNRYCGYRPIYCDPYRGCYCA
jgi:hypothetical protein